MSDALSDIARDERRSSRAADYLRSLLEFLQEPSDERRGIVVAMAANVDRVPRGYNGSKTNWSKDLSQRLDLLVAGDKNAWAKFLFSLSEQHIVNLFKAISPFAGKMLISVDYGCGFVHIGGDIQPFLDRLIGWDNNCKTYDADKYMVIMNQPDLSDAEVHWLACGIVGVDGPRRRQ